MAMDQYKNVIQLSEDISYPDGFNIIEVNGTGDERKTPIFAIVDVNGPATMTADGESIGRCTLYIKDVNESNPFEGNPGFLETITPSSPTEFTTSLWIDNMIGVYEDAARTIQIPAQYITYEGKKVHISELYTSFYAPPGYGGGLYYQQVYCEYDGLKTASLRVGAQNAQQWWEHTPADSTTEDVNSIQGTLYLDAAGTQECIDGDIPLPNVTGQTVTVPFWFKPEISEVAGTAFINGVWRGVADTWPIQILAGDVGANISISVDADPGTIAPVDARSTVTARVSDGDGFPITSGEVTFSIQAGGGHLIGPIVQLTKEEGIEEEPNSSSTTQFSTGLPIVKITSIEVVGEPSWVWNGQAAIDGNQVTLVGQVFSNDIVPLLVTYDAGGFASTIYVSNDEDGDVVWVRGAHRGKSDIASINIDVDAVKLGNLNVTADPSSIAKLATSNIIVTYTDENGDPGTGTVNLKLTPRKGSLAKRSVTLGPKSFTDAAGTVNNFREISVPYEVFNVSDITDIEVDGQHFSSADVESVDGTTILMKDPLPIPGGPALVDYTTRGYAETTYTAIDADYVVYVIGTLATNEEITDDADITVGSPDAGLDLSASADPSAIQVTESSTISGTLTDGGTPVPNKNLVFRLPDDRPPGIKIDGGSTATAKTDSAGVASVTMTTKSESKGSVDIIVTYDDGGEELSDSVSVGIDSPDSEEPTEEEGIEVFAGRIIGWVDPSDRSFELSEGKIHDWGAGALVDQYGTTDTDPTWEDPLMIRWSSSNGPPPWDLLGARVNGATFKQPFQDDPFYLSILDLMVPWTFTLNTGLYTVLQVTTEFSGDPIPGVLVTVAGVQDETDTNGVARLRDLPEGEHEIYLAHPSYKDNREGVTGGSGIVDSIPQNDTITVGGHGSGKFFIPKMDIDITIFYIINPDSWYLFWQDRDDTIPNAPLSDEGEII